MISAHIPLAKVSFTRLCPTSPGLRNDDDDDDDDHDDDDDDDDNSGEQWYHLLSKLIYISFTLKFAVLFTGYRGVCAAKRET